MIVGPCRPIYSATPHCYSSASMESLTLSIRAPAPGSLQKNEPVQSFSQLCPIVDPRLAVMPGEDGKTPATTCCATIFSHKIFSTASLVLLLSLLRVMCLWMPNILPCIQWITTFPGSQFFI